MKLGFALWFWFISLYGLNTGIRMLRPGTYIHLPLKEKLPFALAEFVLAAGTGVLGYLVLKGII